MSMLWRYHRSRTKQSPSLVVAPTQADLEAQTAAEAEAVAALEAQIIAEQGTTKRRTKKADESAAE
jgi:hypothetical protein